MTKTNKKIIKHYYVDEAGDLTLFNKSGRIIVGTEGCSNFIMIGSACVPDVVDASKKLNDLRNTLLT
jgi:hypothetical protein